MDINSLIKILPQLGVWKLKDLIKAIRNCKTAADERAVISKESAFIRTSFKEENAELRAINIAKLLYIHMLGYPAHFGQIECLKLVASPKFFDKRLGYLGTMMLLDENQEVLTLVTNCLKNDMNNSNMYIVSLALATLGNIASPEMSRDLYHEVERLMSSSNPYLRKKATLCAFRLIRKVPELIENFISKAQNLLNERTNGPLLAGIALLVEMCTIDPSVIKSVQNSIPILVKHLKGLATPGYSPEHDVNGISDPFIQVKILKLLRIIGKDATAHSETLNDVLAQIATTTESSKNVGNSILYEAVLAIMEIGSDSALRVLGINILGKFLSNKDNNVRYVALTTLAKTAQGTSDSDSSAFQRHRATIIECLHDSDVSIRKRALDLTFHLMNFTNVRVLTRELLSFLELCDNDTKTNVSSRICEYAGRFRPNARWEIDTVVRVLNVAGSWADRSVINYLVKLVSNCPQDLQQYTVKRLYQMMALNNEKTYLHEGLLQALFWHIGEFGDMLIIQNNNGIITDEESINDTQPTPNEHEIILFIETVLSGPYATIYVKEYAITALVKLSSRFHNDFVISQIKDLISKYQTDMDTEIQQRAIEYGKIFDFDCDTRVALLERMPVLESAVIEESKKGSGALSDSLGTVKQEKKSLIESVETKVPDKNIPAPNTASADLYSLMFGGELTNDQPVMEPMQSPIPGTNLSFHNNISSSKDVLGDLFGPSQPEPALKANPDALADLLGAMKPMAAPTLAPVSIESLSNSKKSEVSVFDPLADNLSAIPVPKTSSLTSDAPKAFESTEQTAVEKKYVCYEKRGFKIVLVPTRESEVVTNIKAEFLATEMFEISNIVMQVALPKALKLQMFPPDFTSVNVAKTASQNMRIENPSKANIKLRLKIGYISQGEKIDEVVEFSSFDSSLWK